MRTSGSCTVATSCPAETKNYVPGIIAAIIMAKNPAQYGLDKMVPEAPVVSDTVTVDSAIDLRLVADVTGASLQEIVALNPSLLRMSTPNNMPFDLHIPVGTSETFCSRIKEIPEEKRDSWRFHVVRTGETLDSIAIAMHARARDIAEANDIAAGDDVDVGDELVIPIATAAASVGPRRYTVRRGDTLVTVADRFGVTVEQLRRWNHLSSNAVKPGAALTVAEPVKLAPHTRVRGRSSRRKSSTHAALRARHAPTSKHSRATHSSSKTGSSASHEEKFRRARRRAGRPERRRKLHDKLPHQKECLPSLALGCILLLESRAGQ